MRALEERSILPILLRKELLGCRAGAATESRPYRAFIVAGGARFAMMDYKHGGVAAMVVRTLGSLTVSCFGRVRLSLDREGWSQVVLACSWMTRWRRLLQQS